MKIEQKSYGMFPNSLNKRIIEELKSKGHNILNFPKVEKKPISLTHNEKEILLNLQNFDWLIFTDVFAVDEFLLHLENLKVDFFELDNLRVCAYGEAVSDRLRFVQLHADVIAYDFDEHEIFLQIKNYLFNEDEFKGLKFIFIKGNQNDYKIVEMLEQKSVCVDPLKLYETNIQENIPKLKALVKGGAIDEFIFCSPDEVFDLSIMFGKDKLANYFHEIIVTAKDEITYQTLNEFGFKSINFQ